MLVAGSILIFAALIIGLAIHTFKFPGQSSPVPATISKNLPFTVYYPAVGRLPSGYVLDSASFTLPRKNIVLYSIHYGGSRKLMISQQAKPTDEEIQNFYANYIPLHNQMQTNMGKAQLGAYRDKGDLETVISLPVSGGPWIILTAPYDADQNQLKQVLDSLRP